MRTIKSSYNTSCKDDNIVERDDNILKERERDLQNNNNIDK